MAIYRVQVAIPRTTNLPEDIAVNTFHFRRGTTAEEPFLDEVQDRLAQFYEDLVAGGVMSNQLVFNQSRIKAYDLADAEPRVPVRDELLNPGATASTEDPLPSECAIVISWQGERLSGVPAGRSRGRTYVGPLSRSTQKLGDRDRIDDTKLTTVATAAGVLVNAWSPDAEEGLVVYSHTGAIASQVSTGWVDNAYDTQRRRGKAATSRLVFNGV